MLSLTQTFAEFGLLPLNLYAANTKPGASLILMDGWTVRGRFASESNGDNMKQTV